MDGRTDGEEDRFADSTCYLFPRSSIIRPSTPAGRIAAPSPPVKMGEGANRVRDKDVRFNARQTYEQARTEEDVLEDK